MPKEVVHFYPQFHSCMGTSNGISMGKFDQSLKCTLFWGHFFTILGRIMCFMLYYAHLFLFYARVLFFFCVLQDSWPFYPYFHPNWVYFNSSQMLLSYHARGEERKIKECWAHHGWSMVLPIVRGRPLSSKFVCFLATVWLHSSFAIKSLFSASFHAHRSISILHSILPRLGF